MKKKFLKIAALAAVLLAISLVSSDTYAEGLPAGFTDQNFYNCVVENFRRDYPNEDIPAAGLTDEQLGRMTRLFCGDRYVHDVPKIYDANGLEKLTALVSISIVNNKLTSIDISHNTALTSISLAQNELESIDVSHNTALTSLTLDQNEIDYIDISRNTALDYLNMQFNNLTSIDVSHNTNLTGLNLSCNDLVSVDLSNNVALTRLLIYQNGLTSIDVSHNVALEYLEIDNNEFTTIDISNNKELTTLSSRYGQLASIDVSNNTNLEKILLDGNKITSIDVSKNTSLRSLDLSGNELTSIDVSNNTYLTGLDLGDNTLTSIDLSNNTALNYLRVDDIFVKTWITLSEVAGSTEYDLSSLKFLNSIIPEGEGYSYNSRTRVLTVADPHINTYLQVRNPQDEEYCEYKLVLYEEPTPDSEDDIKVPDTGASINNEQGSAFYILATSTAAILSVITAAIVHKKHTAGHFKYDRK